MTPPSSTQIAKAFISSVSNRGHDRAIKELAALILENRLMSQMDDILNEIAAEHRRLYGVVEANITSARDISDQAREKLLQYIKQTTGAETVNLQEQIDRSVLGGVIVSTPDYELDLSLKAKLAKLKA